MKYFLPLSQRRLSQTFLAGLFGLALLINFPAPVKSQRLKDPGPESPSALVVVPLGRAVVTSTAEDESNVTVRVVDIRQFGTLWDNQANYAPNYIDDMVRMPLVRTWSPSDFAAPDGAQPMHALAISSLGDRIYTGASGYRGNNKPPHIYRIGPNSTTPALIATLPFYSAPLNRRAGVSSLELDEVHNQLFAANYADGIIYRYDLNGTLLTTFDPLTAYVPTGTILPPYGERVNALAYNPVENRLYYGMWGYAGTTTPNTIRSVGLDSSGGFIPGTDQIEIYLENIAPAGDMEFNRLGNRMLIAQQPLVLSTDTLELWAHVGRGLEYMGSTGAWFKDTTVYGNQLKYAVGNYSNLDTRGGVAWAYKSIGTYGAVNGDEAFVVFTGDALFHDGIDTEVYGLQFTPSTGGGAGGPAVGGPSVGSNSLIADLDYNVLEMDKWAYGDVDIRRRPGSPGPVSLTGNVWHTNGTPFSKVTIRLSRPTGVAYTALTNGLGYFTFPGVATGQTYTLTASAKNATFSPQTIDVFEGVSDLELTENSGKP